MIFLVNVDLTSFFFDRRITALALYDYFRTRDKCIKAGDWIRVKDTKFNRLPPQDRKDLCSLEDIVRSRKKIVGFDVATRTFQNDNFDIEDIDNSLIYDVIQGKHIIFCSLFVKSAYLISAFRNFT